ncbi:MAG: methionyl-tRNA formyltransferase [Candidatus Vogelbacteria bacterium]|nr:methionyl-tRNA formyltransferase [Candidatus Vogelbacteria bacterium]
MSKTNFIFFGTGEFAVGVLNELKNHGIVPKMIVTKPDAPSGRHLMLTPPAIKVWADENGIEALQAEKLTSIVKKLSTFNADVFLVSDFGKIIPSEILQIPRLGVLITHQSLLPKHRGTSPIQYAILNGDKETGVSIILSDDQIDHGKVLTQDRIELTLTETSKDLENTLSKLGGEMLARLFESLEESIEQAEPQDDSKATFTQKIKKTDGFIESEICLGLSEDEEVNMKAERKVRAYFPTPIAFTILKSKNGKEIRLQILKAIMEQKRFTPTLVRPEGKKEMSFEDFLRGFL